MNDALLLANLTKLTDKNLKPYLPLPSPDDMQAAMWAYIDEERRNGMAQDELDGLIEGAEIMAKRENYLRLYAHLIKMYIDVVEDKAKPTGMWAYLEFGHIDQI